MYKLIRDEKKEGRKYVYTYYSPQFPELIGYTNFRVSKEKYNWKIVSKDVWEWKQSNRNYVLLNYIPILNAIKTFFLGLKYVIYKNGVAVGTACFNGIGNKNNRNYFIVCGDKYLCREGNTKVLRPLKKYEWAIENEKEDIIAQIRKEYETPIYDIDLIKEEVPIESIMLSVMHIDMDVFSREGRPTVTSG